MKPRNILALAGAIVTNLAMRRRALLGLTLLAAAWLFLGVAVFEPFLEKRLLLFALYWLGCAGLTVGICLLAIYDLLIVLAAGRAARRSLEQSLTRPQNPSTKRPPSNTSAPR